MTILEKTGGYLTVKENHALFAGISLLAGLAVVSQYYYLFFHTLSELFCIVVACCVFVLTWHLRRIIDSGYLLFVGIAYVAVAVFDLLHMMTFTGMQLVNVDSPDVSTQLWVAGRAMESLSLLVAPFVRLRYLRRSWLFVGGFVLLTGFLLATIFYWRIFPQCFSPTSGLTPFKKTAEYAVVMILAAALAALWKTNTGFEKRILRLLGVAIIFTILAELMFTLYYHPTGPANMAGHLLKMVSYYLIFRAIVVTGIETPFQLLFIRAKQHEAALRESETQLRLALDHYPDPFVIYDDQRRIKYINERGVALTGKPRETIIGKTDDMLHPPQLTQAYLPLLDRVYRDRKAVSEECRLNLPGGRYTMVLQYIPLLDEHGRIRQVLGITQDVTLRKNAEMEKQRLLEARTQAKQHAEMLLARYKAILNGIVEGVLIFDTDGTLLEMNPSAAMLHDFNLLDRMPDSMEAFAEFFEMRTADSEPLETSQWPLAKVARGKNFINYELEVHNLAGGRKWIASFNGAPVYADDGTHLFSIITFRDVTRQIRNRQELREARNMLETRVQERTAELAAANENLREFTYVASHDLQEPLRKISYFGSRLQSLLAGRLDPKASDFFERQLSAVDRMRRLVDSLLHYSRASSKEIRFTSVDLNDIVRNVEEDLGEYIREKNGRIITNSLPVLEADAVQMHQLFQNLVSNGLKFNKQVEKTVRIHAEQTDKSPLNGKTANGAWYRIHVTDNGIGIDPACIDSVFIPFQRLHGDRDYKGTGIGLSICRKIVERHGGIIEVADNDTADGGARFIVTLPQNRRGRDADL